MDKLLAVHRDETGRPMQKLTLTLWSVESPRHFGLLEEQALWALGAEPVWDAGSRVSDVKLIPRDRLSRARVAVVLSATGLYRDHFPKVMRQMAKAAQFVPQVHDADNPVAGSTERITRKLLASWVLEPRARRAGATPIFSSESGRYGTGPDDAVLAK